MTGIFGGTRRARLPDWEHRLFSWLIEARRLPLKLGQFDCALGLAAGAIKAQTGVDFAAEHIGQYADELEAHRHMRKHGWRTYEDIMDFYLRRAPKGDRHRGNIVLLESDMGNGFGVRIGCTAMAFAKMGLSEFHIPPNTQEWSAL